MELRNGAWTSQTRANDCAEIIRLARKIRNKSGDAESLARKIERIASDLERELR